MIRTLSKDLHSCSGKKVLVRGWLNNLRSFGKLAFLLLRDRSGLCQVVVECKEEISKVKHLQVGSVLTIEGQVSPSNSGFNFELINPQITVENPIHDAPEVEYNKPEMHADYEFLLDHRPISLRHREIQSIFKIQGEIAHAYRLFMHDIAEAYEYFPPNLIGASSEGGAEFFSVDYFGYTATLAQSSQLYKQIMVGVNERVFAITPFFRAEPSQTTRHLSEGKQLEFEMGFFNSWHEIMDIQEACLKFILTHLKQTSCQDLEILGDPLVTAPQETPFPRISFEKAQEIFFERTGIDERNEPDLSPAAERELCKWALETHGTEFIFITEWKEEKRPFYSFPSGKDLTNTFDLLCGGIEITSGGQRRHTYDSMVDGIKAKGMNPEDFTDYLSIFKYGIPAHGGFGMGLERLTMTLLKRKNIRETSLFPSDPKRIASTRIKAHIFFGGENIRSEIIRLCHRNEFPIDYQKHEDTPTSEDASRVRDIPLEMGIKALLLRGKSSKKNYQFNIPANKKLDVKAASKIVGEKCEFEKPETILERYGLIIGGIPPFGNLLNLDNYFDDACKTGEMSAFNCGLPSESIVMASEHLFAIADPKWGNFSKEE